LLIHKHRYAASIDPPWLKLADLQAPIRHKHRSTSANSLSLSLLVRTCLGVFDFVVDFFILCLWECVCVSEEEEDDEGEKMRWFCRWRREIKKRNEM